MVSVRATLECPECVTTMGPALASVPLARTASRILRRSEMYASAWVNLKFGIGILLVKLFEKACHSDDMTRRREARSISQSVVGSASHIAPWTLIARESRAGPPGARSRSESDL